MGFALLESLHALDILLSLVGSKRSYLLCRKIEPGRLWLSGLLLLVHLLLLSLPGSLLSIWIRNLNNIITTSSLQALALLRLSWR